MSQIRKYIKDFKIITVYIAICITLNYLFYGFIEFFSRQAEKIFCLNISSRHTIDIGLRKAFSYKIFYSESV